MITRQFIDEKIEDHEVMAQIQSGMIRGLDEIRLGDAIIKLTHVQFEKHIAPWEK